AGAPRGAASGALCRFSISCRGSARSASWPCWPSATGPTAKPRRGSADMGVEILSLLGLSSVFGLIGLVLAGWMAWRIVEKTGLPGWAGLGAILLTLTGVGTIVPLILLWVFAFMRWPRDELAGAPAASSPGRPASPASLPPPPAALADRRAWRLSGLSAGGPVALSLDGAQPAPRATRGGA